MAVLFRRVILKNGDEVYEENDLVSEEERKKERQDETGEQQVLMLLTAFRAPSSRDGFHFRLSVSFWQDCDDVRELGGTVVAAFAHIPPSSCKRSVGGPNVFPVVPRLAPLRFLVLLRGSFLLA